MSDILPAASTDYTEPGTLGPYAERFARYGAVQINCRPDLDWPPVAMAVRGAVTAMTLEDLRDLARVAAEVLEWVDRREAAGAAVAQVAEIARRSVAMGETGEQSRDDVGRVAA